MFDKDPNHELAFQKAAYPNVWFIKVNDLIPEAPVCFNVVPDILKATYKLKDLTVCVHLGAVYKKNYDRALQALTVSTELGEGIDAAKGKVKDAEQKLADFDAGFVSGFEGLSLALKERAELLGAPFQTMVKLTSADAKWQARFHIVQQELNVPPERGQNKKMTPNPEYDPNSASLTWTFSAMEGCRELVKLAIDITDDKTICEFVPWSPAIKGLWSNTVTQPASGYVYVFICFMI